MGVFFFCFFCFLFCARTNSLSHTHHKSTPARTHISKTKIIQANRERERVSEKDKKERKGGGKKGEQEKERVKV